MFQVRLSCNDVGICVGRDQLLEKHQLHARTGSGDGKFPTNPGILSKKGRENGAYISIHPYTANVTSRGNRSRRIICSSVMVLNFLTSVTDAIDLGRNFTSPIHLIFNNGGLLTTWNNVLCDDIIKLA